MNSATLGRLSTIATVLRDSRTLLINNSSLIKYKSCEYNEFFNATNNSNGICYVLSVLYSLEFLIHLILLIKRMEIGRKSMGSNNAVVNVLQEEEIEVIADIIVIDIVAEVEVVTEINVVGEIVPQSVEVAIVQVPVVTVEIVEGIQTQQVLQRMIK